MDQAPTYTSALRAALAGVDLTDRDQAVVRLAYGYAQQLDDEPESLEAVGPKLLAALDALQLTPRSYRPKGVKPDEQPTASPLDELRQRRAARQRRTQAVDTTAS